MSEVANRVLKNSGYLYFSMGLSMFVSLYSTRLILMHSEAPILAYSALSEEQSVC